MRTCPACGAQTMYVICHFCGHDRSKNTPEEEAFIKAAEQAETNSTPPEAVTLDTIKMLRAQRRYDAADDLLRTYHQNKAEAKRTLRKELSKQHQRATKTAKKRLGLCVEGACEQPRTTQSVYCAEHYATATLYHALEQTINRKRGAKCWNCNNPKQKNSRLCPDCNEKEKQLNKQYKHYYNVRRKMLTTPATITDYEGKTIKIF